MRYLRFIVTIRQGHGKTFEQIHVVQPDDNGMHQGIEYQKHLRLQNMNSILYFIYTYSKDLAEMPMNIAMKLFPEDVARIEAYILDLCKTTILESAIGAAGQPHVPPFTGEPPF